MKQGQWKVITILVAFMMAISFTTSIFVYAETPEEQKKKEQQQQEQQKQLKKQQDIQKQQQQKQQQEQLKKQQDLQRQQQQQQQKLQQEQLKKQQEQQKLQRPTGPTPGGPGPGIQPQIGQPPVQKQPSQPVIQPGQPGVPVGQQPGQHLQHPTGPTPGGPRPGIQPQIGQPPVQKQPSQPVIQPGQPGVPVGQQPGQHLQRPTEPKPGVPVPTIQPQTSQPPVQKQPSQPGSKVGKPEQGQNQTNMNVRQRPTINIKQPPQERQRALTERHKEIKPEHNARAAVHFQSERARFKPISRVVVRQSPEIQRRVFARHHFHPETYHARRVVFYETYQYHTPVWAFSLQPRFGLWDTPALAFIVAHAADEQYALWYYSHRIDPDVIAWRMEMNRLAADNAELAQQLAVMDAKTRELEERSVQVDNSYVPPEMEDIALAAEVAVPAQDQNDQVPQPVQPAPPQNNNDAVQQKLDQLQEEIDRLKQQQQYQEPPAPAESYP